MRLWLQWGMVLAAWVLGTLAVRIWPRISEINQNLQIDIHQEIDIHQKEDLISIILFKPFHYLISILFIVLFLMILSAILRKVIYECKVAYLFKKFPYEPAFLLAVTLALYIHILLHFPLLCTVLTIVVALIELFTYLPQRKSDAVYVREG